MSEENDRLADFSTDRRVLFLSFLALFVGALGALVAKALVWLIALITNLAYFQRISTAPVSPSQNTLGWGAVLVPIVGALAIGLMRRLGVIVLVLGLAGFVIASSKRGSYDSVQGALKAAISSEEKGKKDFWEAARWVSLGAGVIGLVLVIFPGKKT